MVAFQVVFLLGETVAQSRCLEAGDGIRWEAGDGIRWLPGLSFSSRLPGSCRVLGVIYFLSQLPQDQSLSLTSGQV